MMTRVRRYVTIRAHADPTSLVTPTTLSAVLAQKAYMLFYVKHSLEYTGRAT